MSGSEMNPADFVNRFARTEKRSHGWGWVCNWAETQYIYRTEYAGVLCVGRNFTEGDEMLATVVEAID